MKRVTTGILGVALVACVTAAASAQVIFDNSFTAAEGFMDGSINFGPDNPDGIVGQGPWMVEDSAGVGTLRNQSGTAFVRAVFGLTFGHTEEFPDPFTQATVNGLAAGDSLEIEATGMNWPGPGPNLGVFGLARINGNNILGQSNMAAGVQFTSDGTNVFIDTNTNFTPNQEFDTGIALGTDFDYLQRFVSDGAGLFDIEHHFNGTLLTTTEDVAIDFMPVDFNSDDTGGFIQDFGAAGTHSVDSLRLEVFTTVVGPDGDFDGDLDVDGADFLEYQRDTNLTIADLADWNANYGGGVPAVGAVPEPSALCLLGLAAMGLTGMRKRS